MKHTPYRRLKTELKQRGITYQQLAQQLGISASSVWKKINGLSDFYLDETLRMEEAYDIAVDVFLCQ